MVVKSIWIHPDKIRFLTKKTNHNDNPTRANGIEPASSGITHELPMNSTITDPITTGHSEEQQADLSAAIRNQDIRATLGHLGLPSSKQYEEEYVLALKRGKIPSRGEDATEIIEWIDTCDSTR